MNRNLRKVLFVFTNLWVEKTIGAFLVLVGILVLTHYNLELIFSDHLFYTLAFTGLIFSLFILACASAICIFISMNLNTIFPYLASPEIKSVKKISRETKLSPLKIYLLFDAMKIIQKF